MSAPQTSNPAKLLAHWDPEPGIAAFHEDWEALEGDSYVTEGYRSRRYAVMRFANGTLAPLPLEPHFQQKAHNPLFGGRYRQFAPISDAFLESPSLHALVQKMVTTTKVQDATWRLQLHQFRIMAPGDPTPEGFHRDGADFTLIMMIKSQNVTGGETLIGTDDTPNPTYTATLNRPGEALFLDDRHYKHKTSPIDAQDPQHPAFRDTFVMTMQRQDA